MFLCSSEWFFYEAESDKGPTLADDIQSGLCAPLRIHRELALLKLTAQLKDVESGSKAVAFLDAIFRIVLKLLAALEWQSRLGGLESAQIICRLGNANDNFLDGVICQCRVLLQDSEPRVRSAVAECIRELAAKRGADTIKELGPSVVSLIKQSFDRKSEAALVKSSDSQADPAASGQGPRVTSTTERAIDSEERPASFSTAEVCSSTTGTGAPEHEDSAEPLNLIAQETVHNNTVCQKERGQGTAWLSQPSSLPCNSFSSSQSSPEGAEGHTASYFTREVLKASYQQQVPGQGPLRHDSEGWGCLESAYKALQGLIEGCGPSCLPWITPEIVTLLCASLRHQNRFVRERGHHLASALLTAASDCNDTTRKLLSQLTPLLSDGLNDSWPHVRYSASAATRVCLTVAKQHGMLDDVLPVLLPPMLFNRHSVAEGLQRYSQTTWELIMGDSGRAAVARYFPQVLNFYCRQARANNTEFREAACGCLSELARKIDRGLVLPHVPAMLTVVIGCLRDSSWPVREAACEASGDFALEYAEQTHPVLPTLWTLWFDHAAETVASVRATAAAAIGKAVCAYGEEALTVVLPKTQNLLRSVHKQAPDHDKFVQTKYSVAARREDAPAGPFGSDGQDDGDDALFRLPSQLRPITFTSTTSRGQTGSGVRVGATRGEKLFSTSAMSKEPNDCCMDAGFTRQREAWEASDGGVYLTTELAAVTPDDSMQLLMPLLAEAAAMEHYAHACHLQETIWKQLPKIGQHLGKRSFKRFLEPFLTPLFRCVQSSEHLNNQHAAIQLCAFLRDWLGPRIFAGRLTAEQQQLMLQFVPLCVVHTAKSGCLLTNTAKPLPQSS